ncbi:MAG: DUF1819 family protein [Chloroflexi bacterium]|nr:DUF1819 family protein [Chloroflexota bacterium]
MPSEQTRKYLAHLQRGGTGLVEMRRLLDAYAEYGDWEQLKVQARAHNLLGKTSAHMIDALLAAFKRRFLQPLGLPGALTVAMAMRSAMPEAAKTQVLFPYYVRSDALVERCYRDLVLPRITLPGAALCLDEVRVHLQHIGEQHPEVCAWSAYLQLRWSRGFLALLRHFHLLERYPSTALQRLWLLPEAFAFFWLGLWFTSGSYWSVTQDDLWPLLQTNAEMSERLLNEGHMKGWWSYQRLGGIVQFQPRYNSMEEWLQHGLA